MVKRKPGRLLDSEVAILAVLAESPSYSMALKQRLGTRRQTMDSALHRLDRMGLVLGQWDPSTYPPRRIYKLTAKGRRALAKAQ